MTKNSQTWLKRSAAGLLGVAMGSSAFAMIGDTEADRMAAAEQIADLERQLEAAQAALEASGVSPEIIDQEMEAIQTVEAMTASPSIGPLSFGGGLRYNYVYNQDGTNPNNGAPYDAGKGGIVRPDVFILNASLQTEQNLSGFASYRFYTGTADNGAQFQNGYLVQGYLTYDFEWGDNMQFGLFWRPVGYSRFGISTSYNLTQDNYVTGIYDNADLGIGYNGSFEDLSYTLAVFGPQPGIGGTADGVKSAARYGKDPVKFDSANGRYQNGQGYEKEFTGAGRVNQMITIDDQWTLNVGTGGMIGHLKNKGNVDNGKDGTLYNVNGWLVADSGPLSLAGQIQYYNYDIDPDTIGVGDFGGYTFIAAEAVAPSFMGTYTIETPEILWLDFVQPVVEYSIVSPNTGDFKDSQLWLMGARFVHNGFYVNPQLYWANTGQSTTANSTSWKRGFYTNIAYYF